MVNLSHINNDILQEITGLEKNQIKKSSIIKRNTDNLSKFGEFWFLTNLKAWSTCLNRNEISTSKNILDYYLKKHSVDTEHFSDTQIQQEAFKLLLLTSKSWVIPIEKLYLVKDRVCIFLNRSIIIPAVIKEVLRCGKSYGTGESTGKNICLHINEDPQSDLTNARLKTLKNVCDKILISQGYTVKDEDSGYTYLLTTKSLGKVENNDIKYICGVVMNPELNTKETSLTLLEYLEHNINALKSTNEGRILQSDHEEIWIKKITEAVVTFELLSVKPSQTVFITLNADSNRGVSSNKGGVFILYNTARISAILDKFEEKKKSQKYPDLWDIDAVDFNQLVLEDEWSLIYNFILNYPDVLSNTIQFDGRHEFCPHALCFFLSHLSQKFSVYYRHTRILTEGRDHLIPTLMARLYFLKALHIVVNNVLDILNIVPLSRM